MRRAPAYPARPRLPTPGLPDSGHGALPIHPSVLYLGTPVALVTTLDAGGAANITPMPSLRALEDRLVLGLSSQGRGCINLLRSGEAVVNLPEPPLHAAIERIARTTGRTPVPDAKRAMGYRHEADKFALGGFTRTGSQRVAPPRIAQCPLQLEARLLHARGSAPGADEDAQDPGVLVIELAVVRVHAHPGIVVDGTQHVDTARWSPLLYVFRHDFGAGERRGRDFRAET